MTLSIFIPNEKTAQFSQDIIDAFNKYQDYSEQLEYDKYENPQGKNANSTRLFNKFYKLCTKNGVDTFKACAILGNARN